MIIQLDRSRPFDLNLTLCCGQAFRWEKVGDWWYGVVRGRVVKVREKGRGLEFMNVDRAFVADYFGLKDDLSEILSEIRKDDCIGSAIDHCAGLRILRQEPWECLISYICATYKNIASIKRMLHALSKKFGESLSFEEKTYFAFPTAATLAKANMKELKKCELGYRAKYVHETAEIVSKSELELENLRHMAYEDARTTLLDFPGVGRKVTDCVLLFSMDKTEAFPVDRWVRRALMRCYSEHFPKAFVSRVCGETGLSDSQYEQLRKFGREYFGKHAGYAQEYLYHYERTQGN